MNEAADTQAGSRPGIVGRFFGRIAAVITECAQAQRRMTELATAPDRYLPDPDAAPDTYAEFLFRTSGVLRREPSARTRARAGR